MAKLESIPEIVQVLDHFQDNNTAYIVMEFLEGETLKDRTARLGRIPSGELLELLDALPEKYRAVLHLYYCEGYATDEIAAILGRRAATVRSQLSRGRALLRDAWKGAEDV